MNTSSETLRKLLDKGVDLADNLVLGVIAMGTFALAVQMVSDIALDFLNQEPHGLAYMVNELMYPLIVMELFRQIVRQIRREPFSLRPFLAIGVIASVRGMLVVQMKLGVGDLDWQSGAVSIATFALVILLLIAAYHLSFRADTSPGR